MDKNEPPRGKPRGILKGKKSFYRSPAAGNYTLSPLKKDRTMYNIFYRTLKSISLSIVFLLLLGFGYMETHAAEAKLAQATFFVY